MQFTITAIDFINLFHAKILVDGTYEVCLLRTAFARNGIVIAKGFQSWHGHFPQKTALGGILKIRGRGDIASCIAAASIGLFLSLLLLVR